MTILYLLIPVLLFVAAGGFVWAQSRQSSSFDADLAAFQQQIGAVAPQTSITPQGVAAPESPIGQAAASGPTNHGRSVVDYPSRLTATDQRS